MRSSKSFELICIMVFRTLYTRATIVLEDGGGRTKNGEAGGKTRERKRMGENQERRSKDEGGNITD